jgi:hypothetical protein
MGADRPGHDQRINAPFPGLIIELPQPDFHESLGPVEAERRQIVARDLQNPAIERPLAGLFIKGAKNSSAHPLPAAGGVGRDGKQFRVIAGLQGQTECDWFAFVRDDDSHRF